jgi:SAM-dependent methyltransferase
MTISGGIGHPRWQEISADPNDPGIMERRRAVVSRARSPRLIEDRIAYLCDCVGGKTILDIGVVAHTLDAYTSQLWLHGHLHKHAKSCLGIDILAREIDELKRRGYNVEVADITREPLPHKFEIILAGEVIEHVEAPGRLMENCASMLSPGGRLILTTPNPWHVNAIVKNLLAKETFVDSADHVAWYDAATLFELGQRNGLVLDKFSGIAGATPRATLARLFFSVKPVLIALGAAPLIFSKSIVYEFVKLR